MSPSEGLEMIRNLIHSVFFVENPKKALTHQQDTVEDGGCFLKFESPSNWKRLHRN